MISVSQLSKRMNVSARRLQQIIKEIKKTDDADKIKHKKGKIDEVEFFIAYIKLIEDKNKKAKSKDSELEKASIRLRLAQAEVMEIELREKNEQLVSKEISIKFIQNVFANVRNKLLSSPNRISFQVFGSKTLTEAKQKVKVIVDDILNELSDPNYLYKKNKKTS